MSDDTLAGPASPAVPAPVAAVLSAADGLAVLGGWLAAACLAGLTCLISAEIVTAAASRLFPSLPGGISIAWEYSAYLMGAAFLFGSALALRAGSHIRMSVLLARLRARGRRVVETVASLIGLLVTGFLAWSLVVFAVRSWQGGQISGGSFTPLWIPQAALAAGAIMLAVQMAARLLRCLLGLRPDDERFKVSGAGE